MQELFEEYGETILAFIAALAIVGTAIALIFGGGFSQNASGFMTDDANHNYESVITPPTCTDDGYTTYTCKDCGKTYDEEFVPALGHDFENFKVIIPVTCTTDGKKERTCKRCNYVDSEVIQKLGHDYVTTVVPPTCTADGYTKHVCSRCNDTYNDPEIVKATGHAFNVESGVQYKAATCTTAQKLYYSCACGYNPKNSELIYDGDPALGHYEGLRQVVKDSTCTEEGYGNLICGRCNTVYGTYKIPKKLHNNNGGTRVTGYGQCTGTCGYYKCSGCGKDNTWFDNRSSHYQGRVAQTTYPTCQRSGVNTIYCGRCGVGYSSYNTGTKGHDNSGGTNVTGYGECGGSCGYYKCSMCGGNNAWFDNRQSHTYAWKTFNYWWAHSPSYQKEGYGWNAAAGRNYQFHCRAYVCTRCAVVHPGMNAQTFSGYCNWNGQNLFMEDPICGCSMSNYRLNIREGVFQDGHYRIFVNRWCTSCWTDYYTYCWA